MIAEIFKWIFICAAIGAVAGLIFFNDAREMKAEEKMAIGAMHGAGCVFELVRIAIPLIIVILLIRACS